jgi:hypothetical protein
MWQQCSLYVQKSIFLSMKSCERVRTDALPPRGRERPAALVDEA